MGSFLRGVLCGVGIGFIVAPIRGEEMRRLVSDRFQDWRTSLPSTLQVPGSSKQISDQPELVSNNTSIAIKETSKDTNEAQAVSSQGKEIPEDTISPLEASPKHLEVSPLSLGASSDNASDLHTIDTSSKVLSTIPGMEPETQQRLEAQGISTVSQLLSQTMTKESRADLAQKAHIPPHQFRTIRDRADLMQLQGMGSDEAVLLEEAGVGGCKDLQHRNPEHLYATLTEGRKSDVNASPPPLDRLIQWIAEAKTVSANMHEER